MTFRPHQGIWPALLTPVTAQGEIRHDLLAAHAKQLLGLGCAGLTLFGTTGEGPSFSVNERQDALEKLITAGVDPRALLVHTSAAAIPDAIALSAHATALGVHGCLLMPPFFFKAVSDTGITHALQAVFDGVAALGLTLRAVLYHIPQVAGVGLSAHAIASLVSQNPGGILGIKDSACDRQHSLALADAFAPGLQVWVGNELDIPSLAQVGTNGAVSGVANVMPATVMRLVASRDAVDIEQALAKTAAYIDLLNATGMLPTFKATMAILTGEDDWANVRAPLVRLSTANIELVRTRLAEAALNDFSS